MTWEPDPRADSTETIRLFLEESRPITTERDVIEILCALQSEVSHAGVTAWPSVTADCFCGARPPGWTFENDGHTIRWIIEAVRSRLVAEAPERSTL